MEYSTPVDLESGHLRLDFYRHAAAHPTGDAQYKGLAIHGYAAIHERVGILVQMALAPGASVLDVASGSGAMCMRLRDFGLTPVGCDLVAENFRLHGEVEFMKVNLNLKFPVVFDERFDCVIATEIIEHLENPRYFLRQCFQTLRPGGLLIISTPNVDSPFSRAAYVRTGQFRWFSDANYTQDGHISPLCLSVLQHAIGETGFVEKKIESVVPRPLAGIRHWRTIILAKIIWFLAKDKPPAGDVLIISMRRPKLAD